MSSGTTMAIDRVPWFDVMIGELKVIVNERDAETLAAIARAMAEHPDDGLPKRINVCEFYGKFAMPKPALEPKPEEAPKMPDSQYIKNLKEQLRQHRKKMRHQSYAIQVRDSEIYKYENALKAIAGIEYVEVGDHNVDECLDEAKLVASSILKAIEEERKARAEAKKHTKEGK